MIFGCIGRLVTALVLLIAGAVLWHFRDAWVPKAKEFFERKAKEVELPVPQVGALTLAPGVSATWSQG